MVVCVGSGIIRRSVALSLLVALLVTVSSSLAAFVVALMSVLSWSEARVEPGAGIALHDLGNRRKRDGRRYRVRNFRLTPFYRSSVK